MIVHRSKFKSSKFQEIYWIFVRFNNIFMDSIFLGTACIMIMKLALTHFTFSYGTPKNHFQNPMILGNPGWEMLSKPLSQAPPLKIGFIGT